MTIETNPGALTEATPEQSKPAYAPRAYSPEYLAEQERILADVMAEGEKRIHRTFAKAVALGIIDQNGNRLRKELPPDMQPGADRDFGG